MQEIYSTGAKSSTLSQKIQGAMRSILHVYNRRSVRLQPAFLSNSYTQYNSINNQNQNQMSSFSKTNILPKASFSKFTSMFSLMILMVAMFSLPSEKLSAQSITNYAFTASAGTFTPTSGGTSVATATSVADFLGDTKTSVAIPIGFTFTYMGVQYTQVRMVSDGYLSFNNSATSSLTNNLLTSAATQRPLVAPLWDDLDGASGAGAANYITTGTAGSRVFTAEWINWQWNFSATGNTISFQVKLYEATGAVQFIYRPDGGTINSPSASIGITGVPTGSGTMLSLNNSTNAATVSSTTETTTIAALPTSGQTYTFTPPSFAGLAAPSGLTFSNQTLSSIQLSWAAASPTTGISGYSIMRSTDGTNFTQVGTVALGTNTFTATGLAPSTTYTWRVYSFSEGGSSTSFIEDNASTLACSISGTKTVGPTGDYRSIGAADSALVNFGISGAVILELQSTYVSSAENFSAVLKLRQVPCASPTNTITIRPATGATALVITSTNTTATLSADSGSYYIIDGRPGGLGTTSQLSINNTSTGPAIRFINDAANNIVRYVNMTSAATSTTSGVVVFTTTNVASGNGNDNNTIDNCDINGGGVVANGIYSLGSTTTTATNNSGNIISNNKIRDFFAAGTASNGILVSSGNTDWTISGNSLYQSATRTTTASSNHIGINILNASGNNFSITNNFIGGGAVSAGGTAWTIAGVFANRFRAISLSVGVTTASSVQGNTIANFNFTSTSGSTTVGGPWTGIYVAAGSVNIGNTTANTIGSGTGTGSIVSTVSNSATSSGIFIETGASTVVISNNIIGSVNTVGTASIAHGFTAISLASPTLATVNGNTIGSTATANSINASFATTGTTAAVVTGIQTGASTARIYGNTIANLNSAYVPTAANTNTIMRGIWVTSGVDSIAGNTVRNLSTAANATGSTSSASIIGIGNFTSTAGASWINNNTVHSLTNSNSSSAVVVTGIYYNGASTGLATIDKNFVYAITTPSTSGLANGINAGGQIANYTNNRIRLGIDAAGTTTVTATNYNGFLETAGTNNIWNNTVYIGGSGVNTSPATNTYAFYNNATLTSTRSIRNNIFINARTSASAGGKHYAIRMGGTTPPFTGLTINNNIYFADGAFTGVLGFINGADVTTLAAWKTATGQDASSYNANPCLANPTAATPNLKLTDCSGAGSPADGVGFDTGLLDDFEGETRATLTPVDLGADAGNYGVVGVDMGATALFAPAAVTGCLTSTEAVTVTIRNFGINTIDFSLNPTKVYVTVSGAATYSDSVTVNTGTLAPNATQNVTMVSTLNMTANGAYTFNGSAIVAGDVNAANNAFASVTRTVLSMGGTYQVGTGQTYTKLSLAAAAYNSATCITGPIVFELIDASYTDSLINFNHKTFASAVNTVTIRPAAGVNATITTSAVSTASHLIKFNGADYFTLNGSNNNTTSRNLILINNSVATTSVGVWVGSVSASDSATNIVVKNLNVVGGSSLGTYGGIFSGSATTVGSAALSRNNNVEFRNNAVSKSQYGIVVAGANTGQSGNIVSDNVIGSSTATDYIGFIGLFASNNTGMTINNNNIFNIITSATNPMGMNISTGFINGTISNNKITNVQYNGTGGYGGKGLNINTGSATSNVNVFNNMISGMLGDGWSALTGDAIVGIRIGATGGSTTVTGGINLYHNTVALNSGSFAGNTSGTISAALYISSTATAINLQNNILTSNLVNSNAAAAKTYAINSAGANTAFTSINYNNYYISGAQGVLGFLTSDRTNLAGIIAGFGSNANSTNVAPVFTSLTDLHLVLNANNQLNNTGTPIGSVTTDIDGTTRDASTPDMGADEFSVPFGVDMGVTALVAPGTTGCYTNAETVTVTVKNFGYYAIDFTTYPIWVKVTQGAYADSVQLTTGTLAPNATQNVTMPSTINMSALGSYVFQAATLYSGTDQNSTNDTLNVTRTRVAVDAGTVSISSPAAGNYCLTSGRPVLTLSSINGGSIQWQESTDSTTWNNVGADSLTYTVPTNITVSMWYRALGVCQGSYDTSNAVKVIYYNPTITSTTPGTRCGVGPVTLSATANAGSTITWYRTATSGTPLTTGGTYTPTVAATDSFFVSASTASGGTSTSDVRTPTVTTSTQNSGVLVTFSKALTLVSIDVYSTAAGTATVTLLKSDLTTLYTSAAMPITVGTLSTPQTLNLGWSVPAGTDYRILVSNTGNALGYSTGVFPVDLGGGNGSVTNGATATSTTTLNYFVYNIKTSSGCESARTKVIATVTTPPAITASADVAICLGQSTTLTVSSGNADYRYTWTPGTQTGSSYTVTPSSTTTYVATATDSLGGINSGCVTTDTVIVTVNPVPQNITITPNSTVCVGGSINLTATSGVNVSGTLGTASSTIGGNTGNPYRSGYGANSISKNQILILASELTAAGFSAGNITKLGFTTTAITTGTEIYNLTISMAATSLTALTTTAETAIGSTVFTQPGTFFTPVLGLNEHTFQTPFNWNGTSNVLVTVCQNLQSASTTTTVASTTTAAIANTQAVGTTVNCTTTTATSTAATRPLMTITANTASPITWSPSTYLNRTDSTTVISTPTANIKYYATATLGACTKTDSVTVSLSTLSVSATATNVNCFGQSTGTITATGTGGTTPYEFSLNGTTWQSSNVFSSKAAGSYTIYIRDNNTPTRCIVTGNTFSITQPASAVSVTVNSTTDPVCRDYTDGTITASGAGGTSPYEFSLNGITYQSSGSFTGLASGNYTVYIRDANACTSTTTTTLNNPALPTVTATNNGPVCAGANATLTATAGFTTYAWTGTGTINNNTQQIATAVAPVNGTVYTVTVTNALGCSNTATTTVSTIANAAVSVTITADPGTEICAGTPITFTANPVNGGTTPAYQWYLNGVAVTDSTNSSFTSSAFNDNDAIYVVMTSSINCTTGSPATSNVETITITPVIFASVAFESNDTTICSGNSVTFTALPTGGGSTPSYDFYVNSVVAQSGASNTYTYAPANGDNVYVIMTSSFGCAIGSPATSSDITMIVSATPSAPVITPSGATTFCNGGSVTLTSSYSGLGNVWSPGGATTDAITVSTSGSYSVVYTSGAGCPSAASAPVVVTVNANPTASISGSNTYCTAGSTLLTANATAGSGTITSYQWTLNGSTALGTASTQSATAAGSYTVTVTNSNGCITTSAAFVLTESAPPTASISTNCSSLFPGNSATLTASPATGVTYSWTLNGGGVLSTANPYVTAANAVGTYQVAVTDNTTGCVGTSTIVISNVTGAIAGGSTYTIPSACGFPTIQSAVSYLNDNGVSGTGAITFNVTSGHTETAPAKGITLGSTVFNASQTSATPITFQKSGVTANPLVTAAAQTAGSVIDAVIRLRGADYTTWDGIDVRENPSNTVTAVATNNMTEFGYGLFYSDTTNGSQNNTIKNSAISLNRTYTNSFGIYSNVRHNADSITLKQITDSVAGPNSNNKFYSNSISNVNVAIALIGATATNSMDAGNDVGGTSAGTGNTITNWGGFATTSSYPSMTSSNQAVYHMNQLNDNISYNTMTSAAVSGTSVTFRGVLKNYSVAPTASTTTTINNNTITLSTGFTSGTMEMINTQGITTASPASSISINNNNLINTVISGAATTTAFLGIGNLSQVGTLSISGNTIRGVSSTATSGGFTGITNSGAVVNTVNINDNKIGDATAGAITFSVANSGTFTGITNSGGGAAASVNILRNDIRGIVYNALSTSTQSYIAQTAAVTNSTISDNTFTNLNVNTSGTTTFISQTFTGTATCVKTVSGNSIVTAYNRGGRSGSVTIITDNGSTVTGATSTVTNNNFSNITLLGTSSITGINLTDGGTAPAKTITGNTFSNWSDSSGTMLPINITYWNGVSNMSNNTISNISGRGTITGITMGSSASTATALTVSNNTISNLTSTGILAGNGGSVTGISSTNASPAITFTGNNINTLSSTGSSSTVTGFTSTGAATNMTVKTNTITGLSGTGTGTSVIGLAVSSGTNVIIDSNAVNTLSSTGNVSPTVTGISSTTTGTASVTGNVIHTLSNAGATTPTTRAILVTSSTTSSLRKNKMYNITNSGATTATGGVSGIAITSGTTVNVINNLIGDLKATTANSSDAVRGINITSSSTSNINVYYNTIQLAASSTGTNFGTSGLFHTTSATATVATLNLNNNIIVNKSTQNGTGLTVAYRRSSTTLTNYGSTSNNNLFYAGTPAAKNLIYFGTGGGVNDSIQTLAAFKTRVSTRESSSISEDAPFLSTTGSNATFLHIDPSVATGIEGGAVNISGITDDFDGQVRQGNAGYAGTSLIGPDMGADEFEGTSPACTGSNPGTTTIKKVSTCSANSTATFSNTGFSTGSTLTFQWKVSTTSGSGYTNVAAGTGGTTPSYTTPNNLTAGTYYYVLVATCGANASTTTSTEDTLIVNQTPTVTATNNGPVCSGTSITLNGTSSITSGATYAWSGPLNYTASVLSPTFTAPLGGSGFYKLTVTVNGCSAVDSTNVTINATPASFSVSPASISACGGDSVLITLGSTGSGVIGTGTATTTSTSATTPFKGFYGGHKVQYLFTAAELTALGLSSGSNISVISLPITTFTSPYTFNNYTVSMANTTTTALTSTPVSGTSTVFGPTNYTLTGTAPFDVVHTLTTPFAWNGNNLVVEFCFNNNDAGGVSGNNAVTVGTTITGSTAYVSTDNSATVCATASGWTTASNRANITFTYSSQPNYPVTWSPTTGLTIAPNGFSAMAAPATSTLYTITSTNGACTSQGTSNITINPKPSGASVSGSTTVCQNTTSPQITFTSTVGTAPYVFTYKINGGANQTVTSASGANPVSVTVNVPTTTTGTFTYTLTNVADIYCSNTASGSATVVVNPLPVVSYTGFSGSSYCLTGSATLTSNQTSGTFSGPGITNIGDGTATWSAASAGVGTHTISFTYNDGTCPNTTTQSVTVNPNVTAGTVSGTSPLCIGATATYTATGSTSGGTWSSSNTSVATINGTSGLVTAVATGTSIITYTLNSGCGSPVSSSATLTVNPNVTAGTISGTTPLCTGVPTTFTTDGTSGGSWSSSNTGVATVNASSGVVTGVAAGTAIITYTVGSGCGSPVSTTFNVTVNVCNSIVNVTAFIEGFYRGSSTMAATLYDLGISTDPTETDSIEVNLWSAASLSNPTPNFSVKVVLHTNGTASATFPGATLGNSYYVAIKHRNTIETWSAAPVAISASTSYNFSSSLSAAYGDGVNPAMKSMSGVYALYSGDINQDGTVDGGDQNIVETDASTFAFGYNPSDCTGDGASDGADVNTIENNAGLFLFYARPY